MKNIKIIQEFFSKPVKERMDLKEYGGAEFDSSTAKRNFFAASYNSPLDTKRFRNYMEFLSKLRSSGKTNMAGAATNLQQEFNVDKKEARELLNYWMGSYRNPDLDESKLNESSQSEWNAIDVSRKAEKEIDNKEWNSRTAKKLSILKSLNSSGKFKKDWSGEKLQGWVDQNYSWEKLAQQFQGKKLNESDEHLRFSIISKARAISALKQIKSGKRDDGMGKYNAEVFGYKKLNNKPYKITDLKDIDLYSKFGLGDTKDALKEERLHDFIELEEQEKVLKVLQIIKESRINKILTKTGKNINK